MSAGSPGDDSGEPAPLEFEPGSFASPAPAAWSTPAEWTAPSWSAQDSPDSRQPAGNGFSPPDPDPGPSQPTAELPGGQYGYPQSVYYNPAGRRTNPTAIAALVCGIVQFPLGLVLLNILLAIPAIICGAIGLRQTSQRGEGGRGMAIAGLVLGILGIVYFGIVLVLGIVFLRLAHQSTPPAGP